MKKVLGIIIILAVVVSVIAFANANAKAENDGIKYGFSYGEAEEFMREYANEKGLYDWDIRNDVNGVLYGLGGVCVEDFENDYGCPWSVENFNKCSTEEFDMVGIHTYQVDEVDGIKIYHAKAKSETKALGWKDGEPYYCADVIFMVFSYNDI